MAETPYNPLDKLHLAESVARALLLQPVVALPPPKPFAGVGIYALYYAGGFPAYRKIAEKNRGEQWRAPIYVGSAKTRGSRKGLDSFAEVTSHDLHRRLREHADSIRQAVNLELDDFRCRYLIVDEIWIPFSESMLVSWFAPLWNRKLDSFGSHDPGKGRYKQQRSLWDVVHPGRRWAEKLQPNPRPLEDILAEIGEFLDGHGSKHD